MKLEQSQSTSIRGQVPEANFHDNFIKTRGNAFPSNSTAKKLAAEFRRGRESVEGCELSARPKGAATDENVALVHSLIMCDRRRSLCDIAGQTGICFGAVQSVLIDILGMSKVSARWVPGMLTKDQKKSRFDISKYFLSLCEDGPGVFMCRVVTQDETWVHHFDPILRPKSRVCNGSILAHPFIRNLKEFLQQERS